MVHHTGLHSAPAEYYFTHNGELNISKRVGKKYLMGQELWRVGGDTASESTEVLITSTQAKSSLRGICTSSFLLLITVFIS